MGQGHAVLRMAIAAQANDLPWDKDQLLKLHKKFEKCAKKSGDTYTLDRAGFTDCLEEVKLEPNEELTNKLYKFFDETKGDNINFHEFAVGLNLLLHGTKDETLRLSFDTYDRDNSGFLGREEIKLILSTMSLWPKDIVPDIDIDKKAYKPEEVDKFVDSIMEEADTNHDGKISFEEYSRLMRKHEVSFVTRSTINV